MAFKNSLGKRTLTSPWRPGLRIPAVKGAGSNAFHGQITETFRAKGCDEAWSGREAKHRNTHRSVLDGCTNFEAYDYRHDEGYDPDHDHDCDTIMKMIATKSIRMILISVVIRT